MTDTVPSGHNDYFIDAESGAEMARLIDQDRTMTEGTGGLLSGLAENSQFSHALDLGCGPGGWVLDVAFNYPKTHVEGIDISHAMIEYARAHAKVRGLDNTDFQVMDITQPLNFSDSTFDLVNGRMIGFIPTTAWYSLLEECFRITQPGGKVRLTEFESPAITTSAALEEIVLLFSQALKRAGQNHSPKGDRLSITSVMRRGLLKAGYTNIRQIAHVIDYSAGTWAYKSFCNDWMVAFKLIEPFLVATGVTTKEHFEGVYNQMLDEMADDEFNAVMFIMTAIGEKPAV